MNNIRVGTDIVDIEDFKKSLKNGGRIFLRKLFTSQERKNLDPVHLAGLFAAKEAVLKALSLKLGRWLEIEILNEESGRPKVTLPKNIKLTSLDLSISHTDTFAVAVFVALI